MIIWNFLGRTSEFVVVDNASNVDVTSIKKKINKNMFHAGKSGKDLLKNFRMSRLK